MTSLSPADSGAVCTVAEVRQFNRFYTRQLGLLERHVLDSQHSLAEARVLYELARTRSTTATAIAVELGLDLGYLSRILKLFERRGYVKKVRAIKDSRQYHVSLTAQGRKRFKPLDRAARVQIASLIEPLTAESRRQLVDSMSCIQQLISTGRAHPGSYPGPYVLRGLQPGDIGWVTHRQAVLYQKEYGWDISYEALVAEILASFVKTFDPESENAWIAERANRIVGSVFLMRASASVAKLRLLYVEPEARGLGLGRQLVAECIAFARAKGYETLTLWTNDVLVSARKIYQGAGFQLTNEERHHSFGKDLVGQTWELALGALGRR